MQYGWGRGVGESTKTEVCFGVGTEFYASQSTLICDAPSLPLAAGLCNAHELLTTEMLMSVMVRIYIEFLSTCGRSSYWRAVSNRLAPRRNINCTALLSLCSCIIMKSENNVPYDRRYCKCCPPATTHFRYRNRKLWFPRISYCSVIKFISVLIIFQFV